MRIFDPKLTGSIEFLNPIRGGITGSLFGSASYALTASYSLNGGGTSNITIADEGTSQGTATFINFVGNAVSATISSNTASINISTGSNVLSSSFSITSSNSITASYSFNSNTSSWANNFLTSSVTSASFALTASYVRNLYISASPTAPVSPTDNELWYDADNGKTYIRYNDGTSTQWVLQSDPTIDVNTSLQTLQEVTDLGTTTTHAISITNATNATDSASGAFIVDGGAGFGLDVWARKFYGDGSSLTGVVATNIVETDTLQSVTTRGAETSESIFIKNTTTATPGGLGALKVSGGLYVGENIWAKSITSSLEGTASWARNSNTASYVSGSIFTTNNLVLSSSHALTASYVANASSFPYTGSAIISGSFTVTGSVNVDRGITGSLLGTASFVTGSIHIAGNLALSSSYALTASFVANATSSFPYTGSAIISGSLRITGSLNISGSITGSLLGTASYVTGSIYTAGNLALSASNSSTASFVTGSIYIVGNLALSASNAITASYSLNGGVTSFNTRTGGVTLQSSDISGLGAGIVSASSLSSTTQGVVTQTINGVATNTNITNLQTTSTPTFDRLIISSQITSSIVSASNFISGGQIVASNGFTGSITASSLQGAIINSQLQNSSVTVGSTGISLGSTATTITGLVSINSTSITASVVSSSQFTGSLFGTASYVTGSIFVGNNQVVSASSAITAAYALNAAGVGGGVTSFNTRTGAVTLLASDISGLGAGILSSSAFTASWAINAVTASYVTTLNQNVLITGSLSVGTSSLGSNENTLVIGPAPSAGVGEGGQILLQAPGGIYTSASMFDNYQDTTRLLRGTNQGSDAVVASFNMHSRQVSLPAYNSVSAFAGTAVANLAVTNQGEIITVSTSGGTVFPYAGEAVISGSLRVTGSAGFTGSVSVINGGFTGSLLATNGVVSASTFSSPSQGTLRATINGVQTDVDLGVQSGDDVTFNTVNATNGLTGSLTASSLIGDIRLGTQTSGDYVSTITQGTGVTVTGGTGEGSTPTIAIGQAVGTTSNVQFNNITASIVSASQFTGSLFGTASFSNRATTASFYEIVTGSVGTDFNITASLSGSIINIPDASSTARGLVTTGTQTIAGTKTFSGGIIATGTNNLVIPAAASNGSTTNTSFTGLLGAGTTHLRIGIGGGTSATGISSNNYNYFGLIVAGNGAYGQSNNSSSLVAQLAVRPVGGANTLATFTTNSATVYIEGPAPITNVINNYALWVDSGSVRLDGDLIMSQSNIIVTGSINASAGFTGSLLGTSSWAFNVVNGGSGGGNSFATFSVAGQDDVIAEASSDTLTLVAGTNISITTNAGADSITINSTAAGGSDFPYTGSAIISGSLIITGSTRILADGRDGFEAFGNINDYFEIFAQNLSNGISASTDIVAYNDTGNKTQNYVDMGINSSGISSTYSFGRANDAYVYNTGGDLFIGNSTAFYQPTVISQSLHLFANAPGRPDLTITGSRIGIQKSSSLNATLDVLGNVMISGALHITGSADAELKVLGESQFTGSVKVTNGIIAQSVTASLQGSASYALTASFALNAGGGSGFPFEGEAEITGSILLSTGSAFFPILTASEALAAGDFVNITTGGVRKASNDTITKQAHGFVIQAYSSTNPVKVFYNGINPAGTGLTIGSRYFLGTSGAETLTPPTTAGSLSQEIGVAVSSTAILVNFGPAIVT